MTKQRICASDTGLTEHIEAKDMHPEWFARWKIIRTAIDDGSVEDDEYSAEFQSLEYLLCTTQPTTKAGAVAQLEYALDDFGDYMTGNIWHDLDTKLFANLMACIRGLEDVPFPELTPET